MKENEKTTTSEVKFDWRSFRFTEDFINDPREGYYIEFMFGPTRMLVPYQMVMEVVDKMETSMKMNGGRVPYVSEVNETEEKETNVTE